MTLYTFPDPEAAIDAYLKSKTAMFPAGATVSTLFPSSAITVPHIQYAWDGTPSDAPNRERAVIRVSVWTPEGQRTAGKSLATLVRSLLLDHSSASVWRVTRGAGRLPGKDDATKLQFVTFTVNAETRPVAVA